MGFHCRILTLVLVLSAIAVDAAEVELNGHRFTVPDEFQIELVAGPDLVKRPVSADFDEFGRLYVTDSNGSNAPLKEQLRNPTSRIRQLTDTDGDGVFDQSTVYADAISFPEGAMWRNGSLYVAAPPQIWKFTDTDDDGLADEREVWFDGKTITHCGNDLHGPYAGPDGWIYWCKGAFAEQTYERPGRDPLITRASHIFRRHPDGGPIESVMTGGMDNPVELAFTPGGERIFTTTFLVHPNQGLRDGLLHAVYGGVYGKDHSVLEGHPRTGGLMPIMTHLGVSASCGLTRLDSDGLGARFRHNLLSTSFNLHKVIRHELHRSGATFRTEDSTLLISDNLDFHPTDVLEDADGSVLVVDTGGWFRLCCPTSQLEKPDVPGGIYRIFRRDAAKATDPRGRQIAWDARSDFELVQLLTDERFAVRHRARGMIRRREESIVRPLLELTRKGSQPEHRREAVWASAGLQSKTAREVARIALVDPDATVRQAALHSVSLHRDHRALPQLLSILQSGPVHNQRAAAEALGRLGDGAQIFSLLRQLGDVHEQGHLDRVLEHSLIYAAIELGDSHVLRSTLRHGSAAPRRAALIALDQLPGSQVQFADVQPLLISNDPELSEAGWWIAERHPEWGDAVLSIFENALRNSDPAAAAGAVLTRRLQRFSASTGVQQLMADVLQEDSTSVERCMLVLTAMANSGQRPMPNEWKQPVARQLSRSPALQSQAIKVYRQLHRGPIEQPVADQLQQIVQTSDAEPGLRLQALQLLPAGSRGLSDATFSLLLSQLSLEQPVGHRTLAVDLLTDAKLSAEDLQKVADQLPQTGVMELRPLLKLFAGHTSPDVGRHLVRSLLAAPAASTLFPDQITQVLSGYDGQVQTQARPLLERIESENRSKVKRIDEILALLPKADVRRGLKVFQSPAASCIACHRRAYLGGHIGPDLSRIGTARSERDLLESILFPSLTFVRNYEPVTIVLQDGRVFNGVVKSESSSEVMLQLDAQRTVTLAIEEVEDRVPGKTSIMPAGLDKQLTAQQLADLVKYLKED